MEVDFAERFSGLELEILDHKITRLRRGIIRSQCKPGRKKENQRQCYAGKFHEPSINYLGSVSRICMGLFLF
jgi:hypothetical protein